MSDDFLPLINRIDELTRQKSRVAVAIDGNCAAGKTSLAALLESIFSCSIISMDDFFLRPFQRTPERLGEPGGNIDYERFLEEVANPLKSGEPLSYRRYDCQTGKLSEPVPAELRPLYVIEGVYSLHPYFDGAYDVRVFLRLDEGEQRDRLLERNAGLYKRFINEWIPMENEYFERFRISDKCDFVFMTGSRKGETI